MITLLLEFGANVDSANNQGCTPLILTAIKGHQEAVQQLIAAGAILGLVDTAGRLVLHRSTYFNSYLQKCMWAPSLICLLFLQVCTSTCGQKWTLENFSIFIDLRLGC